ncbi:MAG TPA: membrane protein insertion efficiency factor YidD [Woeseiaceae bacterium]
MRAVEKWLAWPLLGMVALYRYLLSPLLGVHCRFTPSCSVYARDALRQHGAFRGSWLAARRIGRCHPWGGSGDDPVPAPRDREDAD